jgi:hypothetical protein
LQQSGDFGLLASLPFYIVTIQSTYDARLGQALPRRGIELADGPTVEVTLDDPRTTPPPMLHTDIRVRLA